MVASHESRSAEIRSKLTHPIIDSDGHMIEILPVLLDFVKQVGGADMVKTFEDMQQRRRAYEMPLDELRATRDTVSTWWLTPTRNTLDRATASLPRLLAERLDELGLDFCVLFPTTGLAFPNYANDELRRVACRSLNLYVADIYGPYASRMTPAATIPMHTPQEAIAELEFAVQELGLKASMIASYVRRPIPAVQQQFPNLPAPHGTWVDAFGADSEYDYDPFWTKCIELGVPPACHSAGFGFTTNAASTFFMQNHLGHFAAACNILCKSLFFGGVTYRFPELRLALLECGVGWAADLYAGIIERWEKRNVKALRNVDPAEMNVDALMDLYARYGDARVEEKLDAICAALPTTTLGLDKQPSQIDDFALPAIQRKEDIRDRFVPNFFFGCEADDAMNPVAFNQKLNPFGSRLGAMLSSDIGHWDVADMRDVVEEAYEMVEHELMTEADFCDFTFGNPVRLFGGTNPDFFKGTVIESEVDKWRSAQESDVGGVSGRP
ncbi:MAG: amidohydrolase family protein [Candidatus Tectomicrobia bacterium]|nr:amidohydrolase family protein [Candidatus Tectomicrobia bacterium]